MKIIEALKGIFTKVQGVIEFINKIAKYIPIIIDLLEGIIGDFLDDGRLNNSNKEENEEQNVG